MRTSRRKLLAASAGLFATTGIAGCSASTAKGGESPTATPGESTAESGASVNAAVAAEWNTLRAQAWDALSLGLAGDTGAGARVAQETFVRFEQASGEYGAHEMLEKTSEANYAEFEEAVGELRTAGLQAGDVSRAREETSIASTQLAEAQRKLVGEQMAQVLELQLLGVTVQNAAFLADAGKFEAAKTTATDVLHRFEEAAVHGALEEASNELYETFESAVKSVASAAESKDIEAVQTNADNAYTTALDGSYELASSEAAAGAGHVATLQARGWDATALAGMGGPSTAFAHAAALNVYRTRAYDSQWLAAQGEFDAAANVAGDVFAHFEGAKAHEALEGASHEAYEGFETGLSDLKTALENEDAAGIDDAVARIDSNLVTGIEALAGTTAPLLESAFFRARVADAHERYELGEADVAASIAEGLFKRFERDELGFHETVESTSEDIYEEFEEKHLGGLIDAFGNGNNDAVGTHVEGVHSTLSTFETTAGTATTVSGAEAGYMAGRGFDAAVLDALGADDRAQAIARDTFEHFESGAGGYHGALEAADESTYGAFEEQLGAIATAASEGDDVYPVSKRFNDEVVSSIYAIVGNAGGSHLDAAAGVMRDVFAHFEDARVHELLEEADHSAYSTFETELEAYITALQEDTDVHAAAKSFAHAAQYAQFALLDSVEELPLSLTLAEGNSGKSSEGHGNHSDLQGGPNVVEGVPAGADHVVDMTAVAFEPKTLTVSQGDTVAWKHAGGEAHTVFAYEDEIPEDAAYWASGGFSSQQEAERGWKNGSGAVQSEQSYVHTFETAGTHNYYCAPHEAAGMVGTVVVEESSTQ